VARSCLGGLQARRRCPAAAGPQVPYRLAYAQWVSEWVVKLYPAASDELLILARGRNIEVSAGPNSAHRRLLQRRWGTRTRRAPDLVPSPSHQRRARTPPQLLPPRREGALARRAQTPAPAPNRQGGAHPPPP
jgi:hypothetical protein